MSAAPPPPPAADAPASVWADWRQQMRQADRAALALRRGKHPAVFRQGSAAEASAWEGLMNQAADKAFLKQGKSSRVLRLEIPGLGPAILKHYLPTRKFDPRDSLGFSKAMRSLLAADALHRRGFGVATALACWSRPREGSWLLLEDLPQHLPLHEAVLEVEGVDRQRLLIDLAQLIRRLHQSGVAYRDLKPSNLLVQLGQDSSAPDWRFLDHDRNRFSSRDIPRRVALRDLAAVHAGLPPEVRASERMVALRSYDPRLVEKSAWKKWLPPVLEEAAARRHRWVPRDLLGAPCSE